MVGPGKEKGGKHYGHEWRSSAKAAATKSCREQHQDRPDDPDPLPYPEYDHQGQGEKNPHGKLTQYYEDPWNKDALESLENQQTSNKDNPADCQGHAYLPQPGGLALLQGPVEREHPRELRKPADQQAQEAV